eukprot:CAMPEP_0206228544 /NCGR_PEP_ID=MMETSP0047_2-20121206/9226_1 /ASSEMBLY_ACC=CAM_ASM_000192 /TAXON_ID=195065 /ORGANISM="Chroomonas mesostigmatica_cf, Strain CCMP1168" /LENGTH=645 /DNA_ID=CAMNT_0053651795 /DNA_START=134 /DNA_END=2071 /DNA_ORIENTATION=-
MADDESFHVDSTKQPVAVAFQNLRFQVEIPDPDAPKAGTCGSQPKITKTILHDLTGAFLPGKFTAIMGASGAGKTTMLNTVAGEAADGEIYGRILLNGREVESKVIKRWSSFVFQDDVIMTTSTVRECITLSARLRLPSSLTRAQIYKRVDQVISILHLEKCAETIVGSPQDKGGISGGERKRCAIGMELVTNPPVLFLDEPTTGLDAYTAFSVIDTLRQLAQTGRTVVATIHQPSSDIFHLFDELLVLSKGHIIYQGPSEASVQYFAERGFPCPKYTNPADHLFMRILNDTGGVADEKGDVSAPNQQARLERLVLEYEKSERKDKMYAVAHQTGSGLDGIGVSQKPGRLVQIQWLCQRNIRNVIRNPLGLRAKIAQSIVMGVIIALIYRDVGDDQISVQGRQGSLFFISMNMMLTAFGVLGVFGAERIVFQREHALGMYSTEAFYFTKIMTELPHNIILPFAQMAIIYFVIGYQNSAESFLIFCGINALNMNSGNALGIFIACIFSDLRVTLVIAPPLILPLMIFSGFFINTNSIPVYLDWIKYISPINYSFRAYANTEFRGLKIRCTDDQLMANPTCQADQPMCFCPITEGEQILKNLNLDEGMSRDEAVWALLGLFIGFTLLGYVALLANVMKKEMARAKHK